MSPVKGQVLVQCQWYLKLGHVKNFEGHLGFNGQQIITEIHQQFV